MALLKCPDCGKMVSSRAKACPECGCPMDFFSIEEKDSGSFNCASARGEKNMKNNIDSPSTNALNDNSDEDDYEDDYEDEVEDQYPKGKITLPVEGFDWPYNGDKSSFTSMFGEYLKAAYVSEEGIRKIFKEKSLEDSLSIIPGIAESVIEKVNELSTRVLYEADIIITESELFAKYRYKYKLDYSDGYNRVVEEYAEICNEKKRLDSYRNAQQASRGRWRGGGFGIAGALKGAALAGMLNLGSDMLHSFGDAANANRDNELIQKKVRALKQNPLTYQRLVRNIYHEIMGYFYAVRDELLISGYFTPENIIDLNREEAERIFETTLKYEDDHDKFVANIVQCIVLYPGERKYYDQIKSEIVPERLISFLKFWNIEFLFEGFEGKYRNVCSFDGSFGETFGEAGLKEVNCKNYIRLKELLINEGREKGLHRTIGTANDMAEGDSWHRYVVEGSEHFEEISKFLTKFRDSLGNPNFNSYEMILDATKHDASITDFFSNIRRNKEFLHAFLFVRDQNLWTYGDDKEERPWGVTVKKILFDVKDELLLYHDCSVAQLGRNGIALTKYGVFGLKDKNHIPYTEIKSMSNTEHGDTGWCLEIIAENGEKITYGDCGFGNYSLHGLIEKIIRVVSVVYFNREELWQAEMNIPKPKMEANDVADQINQEIPVKISTNILKFSAEQSKEIEKQYPGANMSCNQELIKTLGIGRDEVIIFAHDETKGKGKRGFAFTNVGWYYKPILESLVKYYSYKDVMVCPCVRFDDGPELRFDGVTAVSISDPDEEIGYFTLPFFCNTDVDEARAAVVTMINRIFDMLSEDEEFEQDEPVDCYEDFKGDELESGNSEGDDLNLTESLAEEKDSKSQCGSNKEANYQIERPNNTTVFCTKCGMKISTEDAFCVYCGEKNEYFGGIDQ